MLIVSLLFFICSFAQPGPDTSASFKKKIGGLVNKQAKILLTDINNNDTLLNLVFGPCIRSVPSASVKPAVSAVQRFQALLNDRMMQVINNDYLDVETAYKYYGNRSKKAAMGFVGGWIKDENTDKSILKEVAVRCNNSLTPSSPNKKPVAVIRSPGLIYLPQNYFNLDGSNSYDSDGTIKSYTWFRIKNPPGSSDVLLGQNLPIATASNITVKGTYVYVLGVMDNNNEWGYDTLSAEVTDESGLPPAKPRYPIAKAGNDTVIKLPAGPVTLDGSQSYDPAGRPLILYQWSLAPGSPSCTIANSNSAVTEVTGLTAGTYTFRLKVTNDAYLDNTDERTVTVQKQDRQLIRPTATANPEADTITGTSYILNGYGADPDGTIVSYKWVESDGPGGYNIINDTVAQTTVEGLTPGRYTFRFTVTDNDGLSGSDTLTLQVNSPPPVVTSFPPWIWILIVLIVVAAASGSWWFFVIWWNRKEKLLVYFLNKEEEALAHRFMPGHHRTEGYIVGHSTRRHIRQMKKKGLALKLLNTRKLVVQTPGVTSVYQYSLIKGELQLTSQVKERPGYAYVNILPDHPAVRGDAGVPASVTSLPAFYIITLDAPLLPQFSDQLKQTGLPVLQRIPKDSYLVYVKEQQQLDALRDKERFDFIRAVRPYTAEDTGFTVRREEYLQALLPAKHSFLVLDLVLHREDDGPLVRTFLAGHQAEIISSNGNTIRIRLDPGVLSPEILAGNRYIQAIYQHLPLMLYNDIAREMIGIEEAGTHHLHFTETGDGEIIAVADTGIDQSHPDLSGPRIKAVSWGRTADTSDPQGHGTHVTATIAGDGSASGGAIKGMAPGASVFFQSLLAADNHSLCDIGMKMPDLLKQAYESGARILNISWGADTEAYYTFNEAKIDEFVYHHQDMLVVIAAGNTGGSKKDSQGNPLPGFRTIGSPSSTKNGLTVGASMSKRWNGDPESIAAFSSKGPCRNDLRIKPDLVAPGTHILSAVSKQADLNNYNRFYDAARSYAFLDGTSMATPVVSGAAALVREYYKKKMNCPRPSAALVKATLLNGTRPLHGASAMLGAAMVPNNNQGYGMLDLLQTLPNDSAAFSLWYCDSFNDPPLVLRKTGERKMFRLQLEEKTWFRVCMVFVDKPLSGGMQSDIDLIIHEERSGRKWIGNAGVGASVSPLLADEEKDDRNNIEIVREYNAQPGEYIIEAVATCVAEEGEAALAMVVTTGDTRSTITPATLT